jgi:serine/threonine protein kinase/tetratricopeptide (TPR) repeat protein
MDLKRWQKIEDIFQTALDLPADERENYVRKECGDDDLELFAEVQKLVARYETEETFLESPVWTDSRFLQTQIKKEIASSLDEFAPAIEKSELFVGRKIGVYRLTKELGRGGMGIVYLAARIDGEFEQNVAIKLIKRGMDTDFILRRFRQERQIAAALNHPNIARLLDGGTTSDGLPYFVLEYVEGNAFFKYAGAKKLNLREKLELFLKVCAAVFYAHKRRIIHRDIKPGNILVTDDGEPKLLDFGIAKILDPDLIHETAVPTATQMRLMTPEYASPEQVRGDEVTEASDQYSLGVLLYELITGNRPYKFPSRAPHEIARIICEEVPSEPLSGEFGRMITENAELSAFDKNFCQKFDRIVLKSLRKNPLERYESVRELAADIERFLKNEPVRAESFAREEGKSSPKNHFDSGQMRLPTIPNQKSIAVLPFKILDATEDAETGEGKFLGIGLADALITRLSNVRQFLVSSTSSILKYGERIEDSLTAGAELRVQYVLDGSIIKTNTRIRISVQLLSVSEQTTIWAERFDEDLIDVLTLEDKISAKVAESLVPHLTTGERQKLEKRGTDLPKAYEAYLRGRFYRNMFTDESLTKAFAAYREAISYDPEYALAYAGIADYYIWLGVGGVVPPTDSYPLAKDAALRAIEIDNGLGEAYASLAFAQICGDYNWIEAEKNAVRAVWLNPNYSVARLWYSYILLTIGRFDEGLAQAKRAVELDPMTYLTHHVLALNYFMARRFDEAVEQVNINVKNFPGIGMAYHLQSWFLRNLGKYEESLNAIQRAIELLGDSLFAQISHAQALAAAGRRDETEKVLERVFEKGKSQYLSYYQVAIVYAYLNEKNKALAALERSYEDREGWLIWLRVEPSLDKLRREPRFANLQKKVDRRTIGAITEKTKSM